MLDGSFYRRAFWNGKTDTKSFMLLFLLLIQQFCFTNHNFILFKFHLVEVFYFYFCWIILHYNKAGTVLWARRNGRSRRGRNPQNMMGEQLVLSIFISPTSLQGFSLIRTASSEHQNWLLGKKRHPMTMARVPTNLTVPARNIQAAESHLVCCGGTTDTSLQGAEALLIQLTFMTHVPFCI